ncbi:MAG: GerMN domain-containing protein [Eubacteriales bacterium]|nr:GerMN domain-containing protein [Eubacteriales bacterium]
MREKKKLRLLFGIAVFLLCGCLLTACSGPIRVGEGYQIYYTDESHVDLLTETMTSDAEDTLELAREMLERMQHPAKETEHFSLFPEGLTVEELTLNEGQLTITFNDAYKKMDTAQEILFRSGVVLMVTQAAEIRTVVIHIGKDVLRDSDGEPVGAMVASMFVKNPIGQNSYRYASLTLYFANEKGDKIVQENRNIHYSANTTLEKAVMEQLQKGPSSQQLRPVLSEEVKLLGITVDNKSCVVNFDENFLAMKLDDVTPEATIYAIVNCLCDVLGVDWVQFQVDGSSNAVFGESLSLAGPFHRNADVIEEIQEEGNFGEPSVGL